MTPQEQNAAAEQARKDGNVDPNAPKNPMAPLDKVKVAPDKVPVPPVPTPTVSPKV